MDREALPFESLINLSAAIASGAISSRAVTETLLDRIAGDQASLNAFALVMTDSALEQAAQADREIAAGQHRGSLHGVPIAVKDLLSTRGQVTACGTTLLADWRPDEDATIVTRLKQAGAVIIGKAQMTEAATGSHHPSVAVSVNPWDAGRCSGFSSSGSGVAAAAGLCYAAIGSDTGGSIRIPSTMNGVTGLKPTWGRVSRHGVFPLVEYLDTLGPLARSAADCAAVMAAIAGPDKADPTSHPDAAPNYLLTLGKGVAGKVIGYDRDLIAATCDPQVAAIVADAAEVLATLGARIVPISYPQPDLGRLMPLVSIGVADAHRDTYPARAADYGPDIVRMLEFGRAISGMDVASAINAANAFRARLLDLFMGVDLLLMPTLTMPTPPVGVLEAKIGGDPEGMAALRFTLAFNISGSPTITLPGGFDADGMPIGFQLVGRHFDEAALFEAGHAFQRVTDWHLKRPPLA